MWLCTGLSITVATLLRCILCLKDVDSINVGTTWSIRETFVGIIAVNVPVLGPWIARTAVRTISTAKSSSGLRGGGGRSNMNSPGASDAHKGGGHQLLRLERRAKENRVRRGMGWTTIEENGSEEGIVKAEDELESHQRNHGVEISARSEGSTGGSASEEYADDMQGIRIKRTNDLCTMA
ncbi:hypothetical protein QBC33DRAFT_286648 [Phialemonium atrogriseum]|uniref:Integral membrane protein n=1 Tax=Phialemonium atrogriseum TaxID=1093897 RepID=A0AAJ0FCP3_9PEZI|nr:uncharacterized protein QBC33DRAFT_286648 [Phialemonium atrogriseum]KAK1762312.1 hypothetical protein QBC33DRAFT_286648 [Phialemonium atrogriseum]